MAKRRDAARTRAKIIDAASREFSAKGFAGARIEGIARRAKVNKQLVYHYFESKEALFEEILAVNIRDKENPELREGPPEQLFVQRFRLALCEPMWLRFMTWEAAEYPETRHIMGETQRTTSIKHQLNALIARQFRGQLPADVEPEMLLLAMLALATYPLTFAQVTKMVSGLAPTDPAFQSCWTAMLTRLGAALLSSPGVSKAAAPARRHKRRR